MDKICSRGIWADGGGGQTARWALHQSVAMNVARGGDGRGKNGSAQIKNGP